MEYVAVSGPHYGNLVYGVDLDKDECFQVVT